MSKLAIQQGINLPLPSEYKSLSDMICITAKKHPNKGMTFIAYSGSEEFLSYPELIQQALCSLNGLRQKGLREGDILLVQLDDPKQFYIVFWACIFGGIIPAPISQPTTFEPGSDKISKLFNVWEILQKPLLVIEEKYQKQYQILKNSSMHFNFQFITNLELCANEAGEIYQSKPKDLAVLQFSSGSTGSPKGIQLTHQNILTNIYSISQILTISPDDITYTWLPHTHDMGLFCLYLSSVISGCSIHIFTPSTFIRSPYLFLKKISEHKGTWFAAPNFAYEWMVNKISTEQLTNLNLTSLRYVLNGAEPISIPVTKRFIEKFAACGFKEEMMCPCYGMAEATVAVSAAINIGINDQLSFMPVGYPIINTSIRIADEQGNTLAEHVLGEIQVKGDAVTSGYYRDKNASDKMFADNWLRTGDLGFMIDGVLVVAGRLKDIIFVRGQNYFANDVEEIIYSIERVKRGNVACVGLFNDKTQREELLVFLQHKFDIQSFLPLRTAAINKLFEALGLEITHVIPIKTIPKTTSGKLQRYCLRTSYMDGDYDEILTNIRQALVREEENNNLSPISYLELENNLRKIWSNILQIPALEIAIDNTFYSLGGNSIKAYQLLDEMEKSLQRKIDPEILVMCKTIRQCIDYLTSNPEETSNRQALPFARKFLQTPSTVAITGMALRFPNARNQHEFWENLHTKKDCISKVSSKRKELADAPDWDDWLGELGSIDNFDNDFFEITAEEAIFMDPQQRLVLEVSYEALDDAGLIAGLLGEQEIGVYSGVSDNSYFQLLIRYLEKHGIEALHQNSLINNMSNMISAQVARFYNFTGAALAIDTACSSFLVAFHHAVDALQHNELSGAVVIGANLLVTPTTHLLSSKAGILSSGKHAKVFDKNADGSVLGEGVVVFYLETLEKALAENKNIYAIVRGSAINNDGTSFALMAPNPKGQFKVLQKAYANANLSPNEVNYIEIHGAGTTIGNPIELYTLSKLFADHGKNEPNAVAIGSVKSNIGHLLPAASGAGLAKILLCMKHKKLVPSLHLEQVNPALKLEKSPFYIVQDLEDWSTKENQTRKAGLSSFGFGGTNVHVILEEWNNELKIDKQQEFHLLTCSAKTNEALELMLGQTEAMLKNPQDIDLNNFGFTRNRYRKHYSYRAAFLLSANKKWETSYTVKGKSLKKAEPKIAILIGDLNCFNQEEQILFQYWYGILKKLIQVTPQIHHISGVDSGAKLADLLIAKHMPKNESLCKNKWNPDLNSNVILSLGYPQFSCEQIKVVHIEKEQIYLSDFRFLALLAELYVLGVDLRWELIHPNGSGKLINVPAYPFEQKSFWINSLDGNKHGYRKNRLDS